MNSCSEMQFTAERIFTAFFSPPIPCPYRLNDKWRGIRIESRHGQAWQPTTSGTIPSCKYLKLFQRTGCEADHHFEKLRPELQLLPSRTESADLDGKHALPDLVACCETWTSLRNSMPARTRNLCHCFDTFGGVYCSVLYGWIRHHCCFLPLAIRLILQILHQRFSNTRPSP
jgi:hypothetical protein